MVVKYGKLGNLLTSLVYKDRMKIERWKTEINPDGSEGSQVLDSFLIDEPCLVNETTKDSPKDDNLDVIQQKTLISVYCSPTCGVSVGDVLTLSVLDDNKNVQKEIVAVCNSPTYYPDHMELRLLDWKVSK